MWATNLNDCNDPSDYAYCTCAVYSCGYSQKNRMHISMMYLERGIAETDCSAGVSWWLYMGGFLNECPWFNTRNEIEYLLNHGWVLHPYDANAIRRNDVLWKYGHTGLAIGEGMQAEAIRDENHDDGWEGSTPGDQDGGETVVRELTHDWEVFLRRKEDENFESEDDMTFMFTCDGKYSGHVYFYDGGNVFKVGNAAEQKAVQDAGKAVGTKVPLIHLSNGSDLIACCKRPV